MAVLSLSLAACGASAGAAGEAEPVEAGQPEWLEGLEPGRVLRYEVRRGEEPPVEVALRVERRLERGPSVAVYLVPEPPIPPDVDVNPRWLVGDDVGLAQVADLQGGLPPLDDEGSLAPGARSETTLRLPGAWGLDSAQGAARGWAIDELELRIEGEVRGDRCARFTQRSEDGERVVIVCARVGIVEEVVAGPDGRPLVSWHLAGAHRVDELRE